VLPARARHGGRNWPTRTATWAMCCSHKDTRMRRRGVPARHRTQPDYAEARNNLALIHLLKGDFERGWEDYEWRWRLKVAVAPRRDFLSRSGAASSLPGSASWCVRTGFGDASSSGRYVSLWRSAGEGDSGSAAELKRSWPASRACTNWRRWARCCGFSTTTSHCSACRGYSAPASTRFRPTFLFAGAARSGRGVAREAVRHRRPARGPGLAGSPQHMNDRNRSLALATLRRWLPWASGLTSFCKKGRPQRRRHTPAGMTLVEPGAELGDFADTAAVIANLDLVIAVDTAVAHLAGTLGKPVWLLLPLPASGAGFRTQRQPVVSGNAAVPPAAARAWAEVVESVVRELGAMRSD